MNIVDMLPAPKEILINVHATSQLSCKHCNQGFFSSNELNLHFSESERVSIGIDAPIPVKIFSNFENKKSITEMDIKVIECSECLRRFSSEKGLNQHIGKVHNFNRKSIKCALCCKKFREQPALKFHIRQVHEKTTRVKCDGCDKIFYSKYVLAKHIGKCHDNRLDI